MNDANHKHKIPLLALAITRWPYALLWGLVLWYLVIFDLHFICGLLFLIGLFSPIAAYLLNRFTKFDFREYPKRLFAFVAFIGLAAIFHPAFLLNPLYTSATAIAASLIAFANISGKVRGYLAFGFCLALLSVLMEGLSRKIIGASAFFAIFFLMVAIRKPFWVQRGVALFILLCTLAFGMPLYIFYKALPPDTSDEILSQKGVQSIFLTHDRHSEIAKAIGSECRIIRENCDGSLLLGTRKKESGLFFLRDGKLTATKIKAVSDYIEIDCKERLVWAGEFKKSRILGIQAETGNTVKWIKRIGIPGVSRIRYDSKVHQIFASRDDSREIFRYEIENDKRFLQTFDLYILDFAFSTELDALFVSSWGGILHRYTLSGTERLETFFSPDWLIQFEIDDSDLVIYITKFYGGRVLKLNLSTLEIIDSRKLEPGIRYPLLDKKRKLLFVSNFFTGDCHMLDAGTLEILEKRNFGKRLRAVTLSENGDVLYAASSQGGFSWKIEK